MWALAAVAGALLVGWVLALSVIDIRQRRLPNVLTLSGAAVILACSAACGRGSAAMVGSVLLSGLYLIVHLVNPAAMGAGDVKLALGLGALTAAFGAQAWLLGALGAPTLTAVVGLVSIARGRTRGRTRGRAVAVPHGPSMCAASLVAVAAALLAPPMVGTGIGSGVADVGRWDSCCDGPPPVNHTVEPW